MHWGDVMLSLARNASTVVYKMYVGQTEIMDEWGNSTGSFTPLYSEPRIARMSISPNKGKAESEMFGSIDEYDRTMTTSDITCEINEDSILWLDCLDTSRPHNYIVVRRSPWKNSISYAIKRVDVRGT